MIVDQKINKQFVGVYLIDNGDINGTQLATTIKPSFIRIFITKWLIGWTWMSIQDLRITQERMKIARENAKKVIDAIEKENEMLKESVKETIKTE